MVSPLGMGLGALSFGAGIAGKRNETKYRRLARKRGQYVLDQLIRPQEAALYGQQEDFLRQGIAAQTGAYDSALADLSRTGRASRRQAADQSNQALASGMQGLASSGLGSSTLAQNYRTGAASSLSRDLAGIDERLAGLRSNLTIGRGQAQAQGYGGLASLYGQRRAGERDLEMQRFGLFTGYQPQAQTVDFSGLAGLFGGGQKGMGGGGFAGGAATPQGGAAYNRLMDRDAQR